MNDDAELLRRYVDHQSEEAFAELVNRRLGLVYAVALRHTRDAHRAKDAAQAVFTSVARNAAKLARQPVLIGWFYRSAHHAAIDIVRADQRRAAREQEIENMQTILGSPATNPDWQKLSPVLDDVINELEQKDRDAVLLRFFDSATFAEIGVRLRLSENAARMRVERALDKLHGGLSRRGITSTTAALGAVLATQATLAAPANLAPAISAVALAGSTSGAGASVAAGLILMNKSAVIAAAMAVLAAVCALYQLNSAEYANTVAATYRRENDALRARLQKVENSLAAEKTRGARMAVVNAKGPVSQSGGRASTAAAATSNANSKTADSIGSPQDSSKRRPVKTRGFGITSPVILVERLDTWYSALYQQLNLSPDQIAQFKELARENAKRHEELDRIAAAQGVKVTGPEMQDFYDQADDELLAKLTAAFGELAAKQTQLFADQEPMRDVAAQISALTPTPLSASQTNELVAMLWQHLRDAQGRINLETANTDAMRKRAGEILQPDQYKVVADWMDKLDQQFRPTGQNASTR